MVLVRGNTTLSHTQTHFLPLSPQIEGSTNELFFSQAFQLVQNGTSYYVHNDIFRLNYG